MTLWFSLCCLSFVILAIVLVWKQIPVLDQKPRRILLALLGILGLVLIGYFVLALIFLRAC